MATHNAPDTAGDRVADALVWLHARLPDIAATAGGLAGLILVAAILHYAGAYTLAVAVLFGGIPGGTFVLVWRWCGAAWPPDPRLPDVVHAS